MTKRSLIHDANNLLTVLVGQQHEIKEHLNELDQLNEAQIVAIHQFADMLRKVLHSEIPADYKPYPLADRFKALHNAIPGIQKTFGLKIKLIEKVSEGCAIYGNGEMAEQIMQKLMENASKAGATEVRLSYNELDEQVEIVFADNGSGMCRDKLESIGIGRMNNGRASGGKGVNLVRELVAKAGGSVEWDSREGIGTWVTIRVLKVQS